MLTKKITNRLQFKFLSCIKRQRGRTRLERNINESEIQKAEGGLIPLST